MMHLSRQFPLTPTLSPRGAREKSPLLLGRRGLGEEGGRVAAADEGEAA